MTSISLAEYRKLTKQPKRGGVKRRSFIKKERVQSVGEATLARDLTALRIQFEQEFLFHDTRKWRADFHIIGHKLLIEVEGGIWSNGRHTRGKGYLDDMEKYNETTALAYRLLRFSTEQVKSGLAVRKIEEMVKGE